MSNNLEQLEFKLEKKILGLRNMLENFENLYTARSIEIVPRGGPPF